MSRNQVNTAVLVCEEAELVAVQGAGRVEAQDAKTGREVLLAVARKSRVGTGAARGRETRIA